MNIQQLVTRSLVEINAADAGGTVQSELLDLGIDTLNMILDQLNANDRKLIADLFSTFTVTPNLNPHTIGPSGATWTYPIARPTEIFQASLILTSATAPLPYIPLTKLTTQQWQNLITPTLASNFANYFYYDPTYPNGSFYFWTVQQAAYQVQILTKQQLAQVTAATTFELPQGYWRALMMQLAQALYSPLRKPWTPAQEAQTNMACQEAFGLNAPNLLLATADAGMPVSGASSGRTQDFIWSTGQLS